MQLDGYTIKSAEAPKELTPEQWLLGMIDQQLAEIQACEEARMGAAPEPVSPALPEVDTAPAIEPQDWLLGQDPFGG